MLVGGGEATELAGGGDEGGEKSMRDTPVSVTARAVESDGSVMPLMVPTTAWAAGASDTRMTAVAVILAALMSVSVMSSGATPSRMPASLLIKSCCAAVSKASIVDSKVKTALTVGGGGGGGGGGGVAILVMGVGGGEGIEYGGEGAGEGGGKGGGGGAIVHSAVIAIFCPARQWPTNSQIK